MKKIIVSFLVKINLAVALTILFAVGSVNAQPLPGGLIGLSSNEPAVLYFIDSSDGTATPITSLNGFASITGLSFLQGTLYGVDLYDFPGSIMGDNAIGSISAGGIITFLSDQNGSQNWHGLASDEAGGVLYTIDNDNSDILTAQFLDGSVETIGTGVGFRGPGLAYDNANGILYAISDERSLYTVSTETGTATLIGATGIPARSLDVGLAYDECNQILYANDGTLGQLFIVDVNTGAATLVGSNGVDDTIDGLAWNGKCGPNPIPTLSEWGMIAMAGILGIVAFIAIHRRKIAT